jgi:hypothetical protein
MRVTLAAATIAIAALISAAPASADRIQGGPVKQNGQCWTGWKISDVGTYGYWMACPEAAGTQQFNHRPHHQ